MFAWYGQTIRTYVFGMFFAVCFIKVHIWGDAPTFGPHRKHIFLAQKVDFLLVVPLQQAPFFWNVWLPIPLGSPFGLQVSPSGVSACFPWFPHFHAHKDEEVPVGKLGHTKIIVCCSCQVWGVIHPMVWPGYFSNQNVLSENVSVSLHPLHGMLCWLSCLGCGCPYSQKACYLFTQCWRMVRDHGARLMASEMLLHLYSPGMR